MSADLDALKNARVRIRKDGRSRLGVVVRLSDHGSRLKALVRFYGSAQRWVPVDELEVVPAPATPEIS